MKPAQKKLVRLRLLGFFFKNFQVWQRRFFTGGRGVWRLRFSAMVSTMSRLYDENGRKTALDAWNQGWYERLAHVLYSGDKIINF